MKDLQKKTEVVVGARKEKAITYGKTQTNANEVGTQKSPDTSEHKTASVASTGMACTRERIDQELVAAKPHIFHLEAENAGLKKQLTCAKCCKVAKEKVEEKVDGGNEA